MQIGELAKKVGVSIQTVRFYERQGLLPDPGRKESGYRVYGEKDLRRLAFIRHAKELGFSLDEIRDILRMQQRGQRPCGSVVLLAEQHLTAIESQIRQLFRFRDELRGAITKWKRSGQQQFSPGAFCALIENTMRDGTKKERAKRQPQNNARRRTLSS